mgnify:CR=1 FL=1
MTRTRLAAIGALAGSAVLLFAGPASAHVGVEPKTAEKGGYTKLVFKVPNEREDAGTTKLEVNFPTDHPLASVQTTPVAGWKAEVTKSKLDKPLKVHGREITEAVTKVTWTGGKIEPGTFLEFPVSVGPLPENTDTMVFKALQTYEDGEVVRWIEEPRDDGTESESPAPFLTLTKPAADSPGGADQASAKGGDTESGKDSSAQAASASDSTARGLGIAGIVVGLIGTAVGVLGLRRGARGSAATDGGTGTAASA